MLPRIQTFNRRGGLYLVRMAQLSITCTRASLNVTKAMMMELLTLRLANRRMRAKAKKNHALASKVAALNTQLNWEHSRTIGAGRE